jgi:hypothetical protein
MTSAEQPRKCNNDIKGNNGNQRHCCNNVMKDETDMQWADKVFFTHPKLPVEKLSLQTSINLTSTCKPCAGLLTYIYIQNNCHLNTIPERLSYSLVIQVTANCVNIYHKNMF